MSGEASATEIRGLLARIKALLTDLYGDALVDVVLFGSYARGEQTAHSDIDVAVILKGDVNRSQEIDRIYDLSLIHI